MLELIKRLSLLTLVTLIVSCSSALTSKGKQVRLISSTQKQYCNYIDFITESDNMGWDAGHNRENSLNQARNKAAELGGNAIFLISNSTASEGGAFVAGTFVQSTQAVVQAEIYKCKFKAKQELKEI